MAKIASDAERKNRGEKKEQRISFGDILFLAIPPYFSLRKIDLYANGVQVVNTFD